MEVIHAILSIKIVLAVVGLLLHGVGIYTLKMRNKHNNQVTILMNLSTAEILLLVNIIIGDSIGIIERSDKYYQNVIINSAFGSKELPEIYKQIYTLIFYLAASEMDFSLMLMTIERLICILSPLHYHIVVEEESILQKMLICSWIFSILSSLLTISPKTNIVAERLAVIIQFIVIILFLVSYILIGFKIKKSKRSLQITTNTTQTDESSSIKKHHLVPLAIMLTYVIFYIIPLEIFIFYIVKLQSTNSTHILFECMYFFPIAACISDALIYIFLTKGNRQIIVKFLRC